MRRYIWAVFVFTLLCGIVGFPQTAAAGIELRLYSEADNMIGEIWHDDDIFFRIGIIPSGAVRAASDNGRGLFDMIVVPEIHAGFFSFHLQ